MSGISIHLSIKIRILSLKSISFAMSNAALGFYCYHYLKTFLPKRWMMSDLMCRGSLSQYLKANSSIHVTLFGILILVSDSQFEKASLPIVVTLFGIFMLVRDSHSLKAQSPIVVTLFGMIYFFSLALYSIRVVLSLLNKTWSSYMKASDSLYKWPCHNQYLQPIITQYFIDNKSEIWLLFLIAHSKRWRFNAFIDY